MLAILASFSGIVGWGLSKALREQHFRQEVDLLVDQIRLAQDIMLIFNSREVYVRFAEAKDGEGINYRLEFDQGLLPKALEKELSRVHAPLTHIHYINLLGSDDGQRGTLDLHFYSGGDVMSHGVLHLASARPGALGSLERYILLPGYPAPITSTEIKPDETQYFQSHEEFKHQLSQRMIDEIRPEEELIDVQTL